MTIHSKHLNVMMIPQTSHMTREYKSIYCKHRQFTSKHSTWRVFCSNTTPLCATHQSLQLYDASAQLNCAYFQQVHKPPKTVQRGPYTVTHRTTTRSIKTPHFMISSLMQQHTQRWSSNAQHTLSDIQTIPHHSTWLYDSLERHELATVHIARARSLCLHKGWLNTSWKLRHRSHVIPHKDACSYLLQVRGRLALSWFVSRYDLTICCKPAALEKRKVMVPLHLAYLSVNWHGITPPHEGDK
jgi:hypothetical protein